MEIHVLQELHKVIEQKMARDSLVNQETGYCCVRSRSHDPGFSYSLSSRPVQIVVSIHNRY
jgi:hypothetical protein